MLLRNLSGSTLAIAVLITAFIHSEQAHAQVSLYGSGYYGGTQGCSTRTRVGTNAISVTEEEKQAKKEIEKSQREVDLAKAEMERNKLKMKLLVKTINRFFASDVADFLIDTHIGGMKQCDDYKTFPDYKCPEPKKKLTAAERKAGVVDTGPATADGTPLSDAQLNVCRHKTSVPAILVPNWSKGENYCEADDERTRGALSASICSDEDLRPEGKRPGSSSECVAALKDYRKKAIEVENAQAKIEKEQSDIEDRTAAIASAREIALIDAKYKKSKTEAGSCVDGSCDFEQEHGSAGKSYLLSAVQVAAGLGLGYIGKRYDETNMEYQAQLGYPPTQGYPTAVSLGFPLVAAGVYGAVTGGSGTGGFGCATGVNGTGAGNLYGAGNSAYGPYANNGGAFGYPQGYYGSPWGGGAYNPGYNPYGGFNGPNGGLNAGLNGQFGIGAPVNGLFGAAANGLLGNAANGAFGVPASGQFGLAANGQFGLAGNGQFGQPGAGYPGAGYQTNGQFGIPGNGQFGLAANGQFGLAGNGQFGLAGNGQFGQPGNIFGSQMNNPQYQMQMMQQQQAMLQQQMQQAQAQYYQAQVQAQNQMIAYQRQMQVQQQAAQVQQEIYTLQQRLSMLVSSSGGYGTGTYGAGGYGTGLIGGGGLNYGGVVSGGFSFGAAVSGGFGTTPPYGSSYLPAGSQATVPGIGTGTRTNGR